MSKILSKGLTFDDVLLVPAYSEVTPDVVDVTAWLTPSISLNIPLVSAAMDTVTESAMAISMARAGGIGIVHKNMSIERQKLEIEKVKKSESGMIIDPITVEPDDTVEHALDLMHDVPRVRPARGPGKEAGRHPDQPRRPFCCRISPGPRSGT